jgi:hypothetical protein
MYFDYIRTRKVCTSGMQFSGAPHCKMEIETPTAWERSQNLVQKVINNFSGRFSVALAASSKVMFHSPSLLSC